MPTSTRGAPAGWATTWLLSEPGLGSLSRACRDRLLGGLMGAGGETMASAGSGSGSGNAALFTGVPESSPSADTIAADCAPESSSSVEPTASGCAPPLPCASPLRGSSVTVDPIDVSAVVPVEPVDDRAEVDPSTEESVEGERSEPAEPVAADFVSPDADFVPPDSDVSPGSDVPVDAVLPDDVSPVADAAEESVPDESESVGSAHTTPGAVAMAMPTPNATANPPIRPMYFALPIVVPLANHACGAVQAPTPCFGTGGRPAARDKPLRR